MMNDKLPASASLTPKEAAAFHQKRAREAYLKGDYPLAVNELKICLATGAMFESVELRMRLFILQSLRRLGNEQMAREELKQMERIYQSSGEKYIQNLLLNEREIMEGRVNLESYPTRLTVRPTSRCSTHCIMCTFWHEAPWDMPQETLNEVIALYPYLEDILWQGGEVFEMKREVFENLLLRGIEYPRLLQNIITNALLIDERWAEVLVRSNVHIKCSIDGATKDVYERIRVLAKFDDVLRSVTNLNNEMEKQKKHRWLSLHFVVQKFNYHQIEQIVDFAKEYRFDAVALSPMEGEPYRRLDVFNYGKDEIWDEIEAQRKRAKDKCLQWGIYLEDNLPPRPAANEKSHTFEEQESEKRFPMYPMSDEESLKYRSEEYRHFCASPWKNLILRNGGGVLPNWHCGERYIGNIHSNKIIDIWNGEAMQAVRRGIVERRFGGVCRRYCLSGALSEPWKHQMEWYWS